MLLGNCHLRSRLRNMLVTQEGWVNEAITVLEKVQDSSSNSDSDSTGGSSSHLAAHNLGLAWSLVNDTERSIEGTQTASYNILRTYCWHK